MLIAIWHHCNLLKLWISDYPMTWVNQDKLWGWVGGGGSLSEICIPRRGDTQREGGTDVGLAIIIV